MSNIPSDLRYAKSHEWLKLESDGTATIGITDFAQDSLGDITYVQLPKVGAALKAGEVFGVVESVKAASDLYTPVAGTVIAINPTLGSAPETVNRAPYGDGWMLKLKLADSQAASGMMDAAAYAKVGSLTQASAGQAWGLAAMAVNRGASATPSRPVRLYFRQNQH